MANTHTERKSLIAPSTIEELQLFVQARSLDGLCTLFSRGQPEFAYKEGYLDLELAAFELGDLVLQLQILKQTEAKQILLCGLKSGNNALKQAALKNPSLLDPHGFEFFSIQSIADAGLQTFLENLSEDEKNWLLFENSRMEKTSSLSRVFNTLKAEETSEEHEELLLSALVYWLPKQSSKHWHEWSRSHPPLDEWEREKLISETLAHIALSPEEKAIRPARQLGSLAYPKFSLTKSKQVEALINLSIDNKHKFESNWLSSVREFRRSNLFIKRLTDEFLFISAFGSELEEKFQDKKRSELDFFDSLNILDCVKAAAGCLRNSHVKETYDQSGLAALLLSPCRYVRAFALKTIVFSDMRSPKKIKAIQQLWQAALELDGSLAMRSLVNNPYAYGLSDLIESNEDNWMQSAQEGWDAEDDIEIAGISEYFTEFFSIENLDQHQDYPSELVDSLFLTRERWENIRSNQPNDFDRTLSYWHLRTMDLPTLLNRSRQWTTQKDYSLKQFTLLQTVVTEMIYSKLELVEKDTLQASRMIQQRLDSLEETIAHFSKVQLAISGSSAAILISLAFWFFQ